MSINPFIGVAMIVAMMPAAALADDPNDPTMRSAAARAQDREMTRQLNLAEQARVRQRDARAMQNARASHGDAARKYAARSQEHQRAVDDYARSRAQYDRDMAAWRRAVAACRAGNYAACDK